MDRIERRLSACSTWLSYSGRLEMVNSAITPIATYTMCTIKLPKGVIDNIDRARKQCLWRGNDVDKKGGNLVAWPTVMKPKNKGGLVVLNIRLQNDALLMKQLHKFYNKEDVPWVHLVWSRYYTNKVPHAAREKGSFWWKDVLRLNTIYRGIAKCTIGDGSTVCFWDDLWTDSVLSIQYPRLASFPRDTGISVLEVMQADDWTPYFCYRYPRKHLLNWKAFRFSYRHCCMMNTPKIAGFQTGVTPIHQDVSTRTSLAMWRPIQFFKQYGDQDAHPESNSLLG